MLISIAAVLSVALLAEPLFESNDDTGLAMIGAGFGIAAEPEAHLIFSHYGYGLLLNALSHVIGTHAHGWMTMASVGLSIALFARALSGPARTPRPTIWLGLLIAGGCVFSRALLTPQFTVTSALLFGAAMSCRLTLLETKLSAGMKMAIYGALVLSFLIRPAAALAGLMVVTPALIWLAWRGPAAGRRPIREFVAVVTAIVVLSYVTDEAAYYFSPNWHGALEYNQLRSLFNDFHRIPWIPDAPEYKAVGWSQNDYAIFMNWYANDPIFDYANIKFLTQSLLTQAPLLKLSNVWSWLAAPIDWPIIAGLVALQLVLCVTLRGQRTVALLLVAGSLCALLASSLTGRPPQFRVWFSVASVASLCTLALLFARDVKFGPMSVIGLGTLAGIAFYSGATTMIQHRAVVETAAAYRTELDKARPYFSGKVISWGAKLMWEWLITPTTVHAPLGGVTIPSIGVFARTPVMESALHRAGITDLGMTLCAVPGIHLIADSEDLAVIQIFCEEHYGIRPTYKQVFEYYRTRIFVSGEPSHASGAKNGTAPR